MAEVIDFRKRRQAKPPWLAASVERLSRCTGCQRRCSRCGFPAENESFPLPELGLILCQNCRAEFLAFRRFQEGRSDPEAFWQTETWARTWTSWLEHQRSLLKFRQSEEFRRLLTELEETS